jgi:hypothetical protein
MITTGAGPIEALQLVPLALRQRLPMAKPRSTSSRPRWSQTRSRMRGFDGERPNREANPVGGRRCVVSERVAYAGVAHSCYRPLSRAARFSTNALRPSSASASAAPRAASRSPCKIARRSSHARSLPAARGWRPAPASAFDVGVSARSPPAWAGKEGYYRVFGPVSCPASHVRFAFSSARRSRT